MLPLRTTLVGVLFFILAPASAQDAKITLEPRERWSNLTADTKVDLHFTLQGPRGFKGSVAWTFADAGTNTVFPGGRGEAPITAEAGKPASVKISLHVPPLNPGMVRKARLAVSLLEGDKVLAENAVAKTLWIFAANPFADRAKWLQELKITLYDPDSKARTSKVLQGLKVPYEEIFNLGAVANLMEGILLVGEGVSFKTETGLAEELVKAASRGVPVLCLAPLDGTFPLPGPESALPLAGSFTLAQQDIISRLDKRLDARAWAPDNEVVASSWAFKAENNQTLLEIQPGGKGWSWLQLDYPDKKGRLVLCGFGLVRQWDAGPTPRYLLARLLVHVTELAVVDMKK